MSGQAQPSLVRKKRAQVVRACDWCRKHRVKCDSLIPCSNCKNRGGHCSNTAVESTTLPEACREIERLRRKVHDLESELKNKTNKSELELGYRGPLRTSQYSPRRVSSQRADSQYGSPPWFHEGIHVRAGQSVNQTWYGPSSLFYFIGRISAFLCPNHGPADPSDKIPASNLATTLLDEPASTVSPETSESRSPDANMNPSLDGKYLSPMQEEYFLELYWQSYHTSVFPILNETKFREHYRSLWTTKGDVRKPSALVDIVVAMSMQLGVSTLPASGQKPMSENDGTVAGRQYYVRCQKLLAYELENPSISTLQCHVLCSVYLCCATFSNMSDSAYGQAIRTAYMLGLHLDPPDTMPPKERELRRRLWWAIYVLDGKIGMKYGRPFLLHQSRFLPKLPGHAIEVAMQAGSSFAPLGDNLSWLSFHHEHTKLFLAARAAYTAFYDHPQQASPDSPMWDDPGVMQAHAELLKTSMIEIHDWANSVPDPLKTKRVENVDPFSLEPSALELEPFAPLWLQRQRLLLELMYHNLCTNLYRPFIRFGAASTSTIVEQMAVKCVCHAMTLTSIMHQTLTSTAILTGWHEALQWQWNAAITLVGFVLAHPSGSSAADARRSLDVSLTVLDIFGKCFAVARRAAKIVRKLQAKITSAGRRNTETCTASDGNIQANIGNSRSNGMSLDANAFIPNQFTGAELMDGDFGLDEMTAASLQNTLYMAFDVDQWAEPHMLWPEMGGFST
ncbi:hypothetical protein NM208_g10245 [Fusarium decemcellulare]|uniref:Uncharacterized protein n=1 Tax=Fusarium decemcellulare TaxID=57161 RepID=A0ACC1RYI3_9HYPO|nr:hypothetical protein NM208_g10245 [Fusarium decemcellulare]